MCMSLKICHILPSVCRSAVLNVCLPISVCACVMLPWWPLSNCMAEKHKVQKWWRELHKWHSGARAPVFTLLQANTGKQIWGEESERWRDRDRKTVWTYVCVSLGELEKAFFSWQNLLSINIAWNRLQREMRGVICVNVNSFVPVLIAGLNHGWKVISSTKTCNSDVDNICKTKKKKKAITSRRSWRNNHLLIKDEHVNMLSK